MQLVWQRLGQAGSVGGELGPGLNEEDEVDSILRLENKDMVTCQEGKMAGGEP